MIETEVKVGQVYENTAGYTREVLAVSGDVAFLKWCTGKHSAMLFEDLRHLKLITNSDGTPATKDEDLSEWPGVGYRLLLKGEMIEKGDEFWRGWRWVKTSAYGDRLPDRCTLAYRRKIQKDVLKTIIVYTDGSIETTP